MFYKNGCRPETDVFDGTAVIFRSSRRLETLDIQLVKKKVDIQQAQPSIVVVDNGPRWTAHSNAELLKYMSSNRYCLIGVTNAVNTA